MMRTKSKKIMRNRYVHLPPRPARFATDFCHVPDKKTAPKEIGLMPNRWHLVLWPRADGDLSEYLRWLRVTHTQRWHAHYHTSGTGALYQGRFKSFPMQEDEHLRVVCRYVERNPLRASLLQRAELWRWSSLWHRCHDSGEGLLDAWPIDMLRQWLRYGNGVETENVLEALHPCVKRRQPFGDEVWLKKVVGKLELESTMCPRGRPRKRKTETTDG